MTQRAQRVCGQKPSGVRLWYGRLRPQLNSAQRRTYDPRHRLAARSASGAAMVMLAAGLVCLIGFVALVVDMSYLYVLKARNQAIVDVAGLSALQAMDPSRDLEDQVPGVVELTRHILESNGLKADVFDMDIRGTRLDSGSDGPRFCLVIQGTQRTEAWFARVFGYRDFAVGVQTRCFAAWPPSGGVEVWTTP